jgi:hypothetical protein
MGLLDFFFSRDKGAAGTSMLAKHEKKLVNMYVQPAERQFIINELREIGSNEAVRVLLKRFSEIAPNTTVDIEERELVYDALLHMARSGDADVVGEVKRYVIEQEVKINWPVKVLSALLPEDAFVAFLVEVFKTCDTSYQRTVEKKQELLLRAADYQSPALAAEIARFLSDDNETIRFLALDAALKQKHVDAVAPALFERLIHEDSGRIRQKLEPALLERADLKVPDELREAVLPHIPEGYGIHKQGHIYRRRV